MSGYGPVPKSPQDRVRKNHDPIASKTIEFIPADQPALPEGDDYPEWHPRTRGWWDMVGHSPQSVHFMATDWDYLLDTALLHNSLWYKANFNVAAEVRLREAAFGFTPADRARLRMVTADADAKDSQRTTDVAPVSAKQRYGALKSIPSA